YGNHELLLGLARHGSQPSHSTNGIHDDVQRWNAILSRHERMPQFVQQDTPEYGRDQGHSHEGSRDAQSVVHIVPEYPEQQERKGPVHKDVNSAYPSDLER